jgi:ribosomal protein L37AE/L43A
VISEAFVDFVVCERCGREADLFSESFGAWLCLDCYEELLGLRIND